MQIPRRTLTAFKAGFIFLFLLNIIPSVAKSSTIGVFTVEITSATDNYICNYCNPGDIAPEGMFTNWHGPSIGQLEVTAASSGGLFGKLKFDGFDISGGGSVDLQIELVTKVTTWASGLTVPVSSFAWNGTGGVFYAEDDGVPFYNSTYVTFTNITAVPISASSSLLITAILALAGVGVRRRRSS